MKKRLMSILLVMIMSVMIVACGEEEKKSKPSKKDKEVIEAQDEEVTKKPTKEAEETKAPATSDEEEPTPTPEKNPDKNGWDVISPGIEEGKKAQLSAGKYKGGDDIPAGTYILTSTKAGDDYGYVEVYSADDPDGKYPLLQEYVTRNEQRKCYVRLEEDGILSVPFSCELESINYASIKVGDMKQVACGTYVGGVDVPAGKYLYEYKTDNEYGYIMGYEKVDNVKELVANHSEDSTVLVDYISRNETGKVYIPIYEGRTVLLPAGGTFTRLDDDLLSEGQLYRGEYIGGVDIAPGKYSVTVKTEGNEYGYIFVYTKAEVESGKNNCALNTYVSRNAEKNLHFSIEEGGVLTIPGCGTIKSDEVLFND